MSKIAMLSLFLTLAGPSVYASNHEGGKICTEKCSCTKECQENCRKGKSQDCKCKECDCKESGHCKK